MFEWDSSKAAANLAKHGIGFDEAATIFDDPSALDAEDRTHSSSEQRRHAWGNTTAGRIGLVSYTIRRSDYGETIRIISARPANRKERRVYAAEN